MRPPTDPEEKPPQNEDDEKEGKAYDDLIESLFFQPDDTIEE